MSEDFLSHRLNDTRFDILTDRKHNISSFFLCVFYTDRHTHKILAIYMDTNKIFNKYDF